MYSEKQALVLGYTCLGTLLFSNWSGDWYYLYTIAAIMKLFLHLLPIAPPRTHFNLDVSKFNFGRPDRP